MTVDAKRCRSCLKTAPSVQFGNNRRMKDGLSDLCKTCVNQRSAESYRRRRVRILNDLRVQRNPIKEQRAASARARHQTLRLEALRHYGGTPPYCQCCQESEVRFLTIDHFYGNGNRHRQQIGQGNLFRWLKHQGYPPGYQVLCFNCNLASGIYGECPHVTSVTVSTLSS